ncbi:MAG: DUF4040 domain-containing protein [Clostridiales bacterium]|nr:DUF4040 domain-containing protein [Clostridiales bacterium]
MDLMNYIEIVTSLLLIVLGILIVMSKSIVKTIIYLSALSMIAALAYVLLKAPDVALTEIVIGSGLITFLFLFTYKNRKKVGDQE